MRRVIVFGAIAAVSAALCGFSGASKAAPVHYSKVAPLIQSKCASCHNPKNHPEKVDLSSYDALMKSGEHGPIVIPGHPEKSKLIMYVDGEKNPRMPMGKKPLAQADIDALKGWIKAGAKK